MIAIMDRKIRAVIGIVLLLSAPSPALADEIGEAQRQLDAAQAGVDAAKATRETILSHIEVTEGDIADIEGQLPQLRRSAASAIRTQYKTQCGQDLGWLIDVFADAETLQEVSESIEAHDRVVRSLTDRINALDAKEDELRQAKEDLDGELSAVDLTLEQANAELSSRRGDVERLRKSESVGASPSDYPDGLSAVDWSVSRDEFVDEWGRRIDAYLSGYPLSGQGRAFAAAAYDNEVDPRWSPAISCIESTKGSATFRSYNAWGWMGHSFGSWEEAIPRHVAYLKSMYGYTLSVGAARTYCPPTYMSWYGNVLAEMRRI